MTRPRKSSRPRADRSIVVELGPGIPPVRRVATALARRFYQICVTLSADSVAAADFTPLQFAVLACLNKRNGEPGIDQNGLAARLGVERSHVSLLVEELGNRGLVERRVNGVDRRARILRLTSKGEAAFDRLRTKNAAAGLVPASVMRFGGKRMQIKVLPFKISSPPAPVGFITVKDRTLTPLAQRFIDCARKIANSDPGRAATRRL
jgi:DNA-binding MarR family transcriptional regulator